jgi:hypothetical protein
VIILTDSSVSIIDSAAKKIGSACKLFKYVSAKEYKTGIVEEINNTF